MNHLDCLIVEKGCIILRVSQMYMQRLLVVVSHLPFSPITSPLVQNDAS